MQARYAVNSREHSYYTFCCSVSPDSLPRSLSPASPCFPLLFLSLLTSVCLLFLPSPYTRALAHARPHTCSCACAMISFPLSPPPAADSPFPSPHRLPKVSRYSKLSCISFTATTFTTISSFLLWNCAYSWITPHPHMCKHTPFH